MLQNLYTRKCETKITLTYFASTTKEIRTHQKRGKKNNNKIIPFTWPKKEKDNSIANSKISEFYSYIIN